MSKAMGLSDIFESTTLVFWDAPSNNCSGDDEIAGDLPSEMPGVKAFLVTIVDVDQGRGGNH